MRLITENDNKIVVRVILASRNKDGKMGYVTFDSLEVADAKPEDVFAICKEAIIRGPAKK